jgi:NADH-quinone oxidoreductase subunit L
MVNVNTLLILIPLMPLLGFLLVSWRVNKLVYGTTAVIACGAVLVSFLCSLTIFFFLLDKPAELRFFEVTLFDWIHAGSFTARISFLIDPLSSLMLLVITGVGFLIHVYSVGYMSGDPGYNRFFSYLNLFVFFMLLLVMASNYLLMFVGWEGVGLCSYLLIGFWFKNTDYTQAANKAFIMNRIGDLGLILGVILVYLQFGNLEYKEVFIRAGAADPKMLGIITTLFFIGAMGKSAQIPLYTWLPDAMAGPTPVSALIHAATMVTAGVYMVARNNVFYSLSPGSLFLVLVVGLATALFAATIALTQNDIKKVLAYSTVSQLGLMFVALGVGAYASGIFHMMTHAFFKALLFLGAGSVIHGMSGEQDIRKMGGLKKYLPITYITFLIGVLAISGLPPFAGFFSKDEILAKAYEENPLVWGVALLASLLTVFYMFRLLFLTFFGKARADHHVISHIHESPPSMTVPLIVLAGLSIVGGWVGIPDTLWGSDRINGFLAPVFSKSREIILERPLEPRMEYGLMALVVLFTIAVIVYAFTFYVRQNRVPEGESTELKPVHNFLYHKYFIDEFYDNLFVKPLFHISSWIDKVLERGGIDGFINSLGNSVEDSSDMARKLQTGNIGFYIFAMVIGIVFLLVTGFYFK